MSSKTYSAKHVNCTLATATIKGWGEEDMIEVSRDEGRYVKTVGADGRVSRSFIASTAGTITLTVMQTSEANEVLTGLLLTDETTLKGQFFVMIRDTIGGSVYQANDAWIQGPPTVTLKKGIEEYTWTIECSDLSMVIAGGQGGFISEAVNTISSTLGLS